MLKRSPSPGVLGALVLALLAGGCTAASGPTASVPPSPTATPSALPTAELTPAATPSPAATTGSCRAPGLTARITFWEGAAGHRIAHLELTNTGSGPCLLPALAKPQLLDGGGSVLIDGPAPGASSDLDLPPAGVVKTLVQTGNYCGPAPAVPVTIAFVLADEGRIVAAPLSPTDDTVPPCLGAPGSAATIAMQPWGP